MDYKLATKGVRRNLANMLVLTSYFESNTQLLARALLRHYLMTP